jgi:2'-5' RNA ligase
VKTKEFSGISVAIEDSGAISFTIDGYHYVNGKSRAGNHKHFFKAVNFTIPAVKAHAKSRYRNNYYLFSGSTNNHSSVYRKMLVSGFSGDFYAYECLETAKDFGIGRGAFVITRRSLSEVEKHFSTKFRLITKDDPKPLLLRKKDSIANDNWDGDEYRYYESFNEKTEDSKTLYVSRRVDLELSKDLLSFMERLNLKNPVPKEKLHVTIAFSTTPVDHSTVTADKGPASAKFATLDWFGPDQNCLVAKLSDSSGLLGNRWEYYKARGASTNYPEYQPHVTLSYGEDRETFEEPDWADEDIEIHFKEEVLEEVDEKWVNKLKE